MDQEKRNTLASWLIYGTLVVVLLAGVHSPRHGHRLAQHLGGPAPMTDLPVLHGNGSRFTTAAWRGKPYILNFFASWCVDCRAEHEELMTLPASHVPVIGIVTKDSADKAAAYLARAGNPYTAVAQDDTGLTALMWGLKGVPETFVIDAQGMIRWHYVGGLTDRVVSDELMPVLENVLHGDGQD